MQHLDAIGRHATAVPLQTREIVGNLQSADLPAVLVGLQQQQNLLQLSLGSASQLFNTSLLNFLE